MFTEIRKAYGAGWRAGLSGAVCAVNPFNFCMHPILHVRWVNGWHSGLTHILSQWLKLEGKV